MSEVAKVQSMSTNVDQLRQLIAEERTARTQRCRERVLAILQEERCRLEPQAVLTPRGMSMDIVFAVEE